MIRISLKNKLFIGFGFLFFMIILLWIIGGYFIYNLSNRSAAMLKENYQTVESTRYLIQSVDEIKNQQIRYFFADKQLFSDSLFQQKKAVFEKHLMAVENNITEEGEHIIIGQLKESYKTYLSIFDKLKIASKADSGLFFSELIPQYSKTRDIIVRLWEINMSAITHKNVLLKNTAYRAFVLMSIIGTICFLISALFFFRYPSNIARPIKELTQGIAEIANRNYRQRLNFHSKDELGELARAFNTMAAKLDEFEHSKLSELLFEKKRIDTIINNMNDAIIGLDNKKEIIFSNTYACRLIGIKEQLLIGKYAPEVADQNPVFNNIMSDILETHGQFYKDFKPLRLILDEKLKYFSREILEVNITKTGENSSTGAGIVVIIKNITRFLEQDEAKTNFMATISHELKTPISSLRLNLKLLDDSRVGALNREQKEIVDALKIETGKMLAITTELLDLAQVETGSIQFRLQQVYTEQLFDYVRESLENFAKTKQISIHYQVEQEIPPVVADLEKTGWVLINLVNNAIQYSKNGSRVFVTASKQKNEVIYIIEDFGKGIEAQFVEKIFEKFFRVPDNIEKGTGLGLAIAKEFTVKQKGRIWAESSPGHGSKFYFSLPVYKNQD